MKRFAGFILLTCFAALSVRPQDKQKFEKIFEKETSGQVAGSTKFQNIKQLSYYPDTLPAWFFQPGILGSGYYAVGISDPDMTWEEAKQQAILRAKTLAVWQERCKIQYFKDIYTDAREVQRYTTLNERFDIYFKLSAGIKVTQNMFAVVDTHFTRFNEYIVALRYFPTSNFQQSDTLSPFISFASVFYVSASFDGTEENQAEYDVKNFIQTPGLSTQGFEFVYREKGTKFMSVSSVNGKPVEYPAYPYSYTLPGASNRKQVLVSYNGLWSIVIRELLNTVMLNTQPLSVRLKNIDQKYTSGINRLAREIASFDSQLRINGIKFDNDSLKFDLKLEGQLNSMW